MSNTWSATMAAPGKHLRDRDMSEAGINRRMVKLSRLYKLWRSVHGRTQAVREGRADYEVVAEARRPGSP